jgi:hypothetical protein
MTRTHQLAESPRLPKTRSYTHLRTILCATVSSVLRPAFGGQKRGERGHE